MSKRKETIAQVDFSYGATRPESAEREDTPLVAEGLKEAKNTLSLTTGSLEGRPGLLHIGSTTSKNGVEVDLGAGRVFDVHIVEDGVIVYGSDGSEVASFLENNWDDSAYKFGSKTFDPADFWVMPDPDTSTVLIGASSYPPHGLSLDDAGGWAYGLFQYATSLNGALKLPYWPYFPNVSITPSARTGTITVTASTGIFTAAYVDVRLRYGDREILLTGYVSATVMNATVTEQLAPTYSLTVASASGYQVGDAVDHETLGGQGIITAIAGTTITVLATKLWDGFTNSGKLIGPNAAQTITAQSETSPAPSFLWDLQMASRVHGFPGWGVKHKGRAYFCRYPSVPNAFAVSIAQRIDTFDLGADDGDAFVETLGANLGGDLLYIISAEDLLFFTTRGLYYQPTRGGEDVTPKNIGPVPFSQIGCSRVVPVALDDGAVFVDAVGQQIYAAVLAGDYYRSWAAQNISQYHSHLINAPTFLGATQSGSDRPENFVFAINGDGTAAVCQWDRTQNKIGWRPWDTAGTFRSIYQAFGALWAVVDRDTGLFSGRFRERFQDGVYLDCASGVSIDGDTGAATGGDAYFGTVTSIPTHLENAIAAIYLDGWDLGDGTIEAGGLPYFSDGRWFEFPAWAGVAQIGFPFEIKVTPWPRRSSHSQRGVREVKRVLKTFITVQNTLAFKYEGFEFGAYRVGDDVSVPPKMRTEEIGVITGGRGAFVDRPIIVDRPGPFQLLKLRYRVSV